VNNEWNEEGAGSEWVGEIDENGDGENGCNATSPVEETPVWIGEYNSSCSHLFSCASLNHNSLRQITIL